LVPCSAYFNSHGRGHRFNPCRAHHHLPISILSPAIRFDEKRTAMITIVYDGACPLCHDYVKRLRLVEAAGEVALVDARADAQRTLTYWAKGHDLDEGMIVVIGDAVFHGAEAVTALAQLSSTSTLFNRLNHWTLSHGAVTRLIYPLMKLARRLALHVTGRKGLANPIKPIGPPHR
jgi:predicted DCC family thiol-disulfide oxidoreductase YuxK